MSIEIKICMGSSCFARGNNKNLEIIEKFINENNADINVELVGSRCENKCSIGPTLIINNTEYNNVTQENLIEILGKIKNERIISGIHSEK